MIKPSFISIDPGTTESAAVVFETPHNILYAGKYPNEKVLEILREGNHQHAAIEMVASYGKPVGKEIFQTCLWIGRFIQAISCPHTLIERPDIKMHLCYSRSKVTDPMVRQRLIDLYGGPSCIAPEKKCGKCKGKGWAGRGRFNCEECHGQKVVAPPGMLHGFANDEWQALALAVTWWEKYHTAAIAV